MMPLGAPLSEFRSLKEFVHLFLTVVDGKLSSLCAPLAWVADITMRLTAFASLHEKGFVHRDVSINNVLIDNSGKTTNGL